MFKEIKEKREVEKKFDCQKEAYKSIKPETDITAEEAMDFIMQLFGN